MKGLIIIAISVAVGICGYALYYRSATAPTAAMLQQSQGEMEWLRREYHLTDTQFTRIQAKHHEYTPKCDVMCGKIAKANARLDQLIDANNSVTPEIVAAMKDSAAVQEECHQAMLGHIYAVSAEMSPEDGARYLQMMKQRIIQPGLNRETAISESAR